MADNGLWFVDKDSTHDRGVRARAVVTTPTAYRCQAEGSFQPNHPRPSIVWYAFIGVAATKTPGLPNFEGGICLHTDGKVYLFQLGSVLSGQNSLGWDAALISSTPLYGVPITIEVNCNSVGKVFFDAFWSNGSGHAWLRPATSRTGYEQGVTFRKEVTLGTGFQHCLTDLWLPPYTAAQRNAFVTNFRMGPVTVADRNDVTVDTIMGVKNYHVIKGSSCVAPGNPTVTSSNGTNTVSFDLRV